MTILVSIALAVEHIIQVLSQYSQVLSQYLTSIVTILASIEQVNTSLLNWQHLDFQHFFNGLFRFEICTLYEKALGFR